MRSLSDFLERFRTVLAPPGSATGRVVPPTDVASRLRAELAPLFATIDEVEREATAVVEAGEAQAETLVIDAERRAAAVVAAAKDGAPEIRSRAGATRIREIDAEIDVTQAAARDEADRIGADSDAAVAVLVARVLACVKSQAGGSR